MTIIFTIIFLDDLPRRTFQGRGRHNWLKRMYDIDQTSLPTQVEVGGILT